jgi:hypothetical protein
VRNLLDRVRALPGVEPAGIGSNLPPKGLAFQIVVRFITNVGDESVRMSMVSATPGFLEALGLRPVSSRLVTDADREAASLVPRPECVVEKPSGF